MYECPFCERHANGVAQQLKSEFLSSGRVLFVFANNPLPIHGNARLLAASAICAGKQGGYWEMHDQIFGKKLRKVGDLVSAAKQIGLDEALFSQCLRGDATADKRMQDDLETAARLGLSGTPAFAVGHITENDQLNVEKIVVGAQPLMTNQIQVYSYYCG